MKKLLLLTTITLAGLGLSAQNINQTRIPVAAKKAMPSHVNTAKSMTCTADTLYYPLMKEYIQAAPSFGYLPFLTGSASMLSVYAQA
jgi:hypothetical protein